VANVENVGDTSVVELSASEAALLIAHLAAHLGRTALPLQALGSAYSVDCGGKRRMVFTIQAGEGER
jgi:hypothetical protein